MKLIAYIIALALLLTGGADALKSGSIEMRDDANITMDGGYILYANTESVKNLKAFGAMGDNSTNDTTAFNAAVAAMEEGDTLVVPSGNYKVTSVTYNPPNDTRMECYGTFVCSTTTAGTAMTIGDGSITRRRYDIRNLKIICPNISWTSGKVGIKVKNVQESYMDIRYVHGFETNVLMNGENGFGCAYNEIHLGLIYNGKTGLRLATTTSGWTNENTFYGGRFSIQSGLSDYSGTTHIQIDEGSPAINNNRFICPSFEGGQPVVSMHIDADYILVLWPRMESIGNITLDTTSQGCEVHGGRGVYYSGAYSTIVIDKGTRNKIYGYDTIKLSGGSSSNATLILQAQGSNNYKGLSVRNAANTAETFYITSGGTVGMADGITAPSTILGYAQIYVDTSDGDLKCKFGDGTTKVLAADT